MDISFSELSLTVATLPGRGEMGRGYSTKLQLGAVLYFLSVKNRILVSQPTLTGILLLKDFGG